MLSELPEDARHLPHSRFADFVERMDKRVVEQPDEGSKKSEGSSMSCEMVIVAVYRASFVFAPLIRSCFLPSSEQSWLDTTGPRARTFYTSESDKHRF